MYKTFARFRVNWWINPSQASVKNSPSLIPFSIFRKPATIKCASSKPQSTGLPVVVAMPLLCKNTDFGGIHTYPFTKGHTWAPCTMKRTHSFAAPLANLGWSLLNTDDLSIRDPRSTRTHLVNLGNSQLQKGKVLNRSWATLYKTRGRFFYHRGEKDVQDQNCHLELSALPNAKHTTGSINPFKLIRLPLKLFQRENAGILWGRTLITLNFWGIYKLLNCSLRNFWFMMNDTSPPKTCGLAFKVGSKISSMLARPLG